MKVNENNEPNTFKGTPLGFKNKKEAEKYLNDHIQEIDPFNRREIEIFYAEY